MATRAIAAGIAVLAALAVADTLRHTGGTQERPEGLAPRAHITRWRIDRGPTPCRSLVPGACGRYLVLAGGVTLDGQEYLAPEVLRAAFPGEPDGRVEAFRVADARDGTLAVAVLDSVGRGALQVWRRGAIVGSFRVPARSFAAGLGWSPGGQVVATYPRRGRPTMYDLRGARVGLVRWDRRPG
jgi:hypothetical protein